METGFLAHHWLGTLGTLLFSGHIYLALWLALTCFIFLAVTGLNFLSHCWNCLPSIPPFSSSFFVLWLTNDGERGSWWESEHPLAEGGSAQIIAKMFKLCAYGSIDSDFIFSFWWGIFFLNSLLWWGILNELWIATITTSSPLLNPPTHSLEISVQSIPPSFNEKRKVTNFIYKSGYWKIPLVSSRSASNSQHFMRLILLEQDFSAHGSDSHEIWGPAGMSAENSSLYKELMEVERISQACLCLAGFGERKRQIAMWLHEPLDGDCQMPGGNLLFVPSSVFFNNQKEISLYWFPPSIMVIQTLFHSIHPITIEYPL